MTTTHHPDCDGNRIACLAEAEPFTGADGVTLWRPMCREHGETSPGCFTDKRVAERTAQADIARLPGHGPAWVDCDGRCQEWEDDMLYKDRRTVRCPGSLRDGWEPEPLTARCDWCCKRLRTDEFGRIPDHNTVVDEEGG